MTKTQIGRRAIAAMALVVVTVTLFLPAAAAARKQKVRVQPFKAQTTFTFHNNEGQPAHGLHIVLSHRVVPVTDPATGFAGPFRDILGSGSTHVKLSNPSEAIANGTTGLSLSFRSEKKKLKVKSWWWTDPRGKRIGVKKAGKAK